MTDSPHKYRLSKSKIAAFEHCPRRLWLQIHRRDAARFDADTLNRFQFGHDVGKKATFLVPGGIMVHAEPDMQAALDHTAELIRRGPIQPIFEATFQYQDVLVRVDILEPDRHGGWRAIEVKASSRVKSYQLADIATQVWVMRGCGLHVTRGFIRHLAMPFSWRRPDIATVRFQDTEVTMPMERYIKRRQAVIEAARNAIRASEIQRDMGAHCERPHSCEFQHFCRDALALPLLSFQKRDLGR